MAKLLVVRLHADAVVPARKTEHAAGYDLYALEDTCIEPLNMSDDGKSDQCSSVTKVRTGIVVRVPHGTYGRVAPRSSMSLKGISVEAGVIDHDYTGEVVVLLRNNNIFPFSVKKGDRIAQLILEEIRTPDVCAVDAIPATDRGDGGFGSTGV